MQCGVSTPLDTLVRGKLTGALAFVEEDAFSKGVMVVMATAGGVADGY